MESKKYYGNNLSISICKKKYIIGNKMNLSLIISMSLTYTIILACWIILLYQLYSLYIFIIGIILYLLLLYYYLKSFFTEPGIIPRNYPKYILNDNNNNKEIKYSKENDYTTYQTFENSTKSELASDSNTKIINNINGLFDENQEDNEKKPKKIFPDFILADSTEDLKNSNQMNNSINEWTNGSIIAQNIEQNDSIFSKGNVYINNKIITKDNSKDDFRNHNSIDSLEINEIKYTPHIFQKRPCKTCNIMRPSKASHCVICDNCILELDHHCFYISNCVGARNRKYFILFLIYGFLISILSIFTSLYHLIFTFIIQKKYKYLTILLFKNYYIQISISFIFMIIGVIILLVRKESLKISCFIFIPGNILFDIYFYYNKIKNEIGEKNILNLDYHPFSICLIYAVLPLFLFVSKYLRKQIKLLGKGLTTKQFVSIREERNTNKNNKDIYNYLNSILQRKLSFIKIIKFFMNKQYTSLINGYNNKNNIEEKD